MMKNIKIKKTFFLLLTLMIVLGFLEQFFCLFIAVTIHECAHILVAKKFGLRLTKMVISPLGQTAILENLDYLTTYKKIIITIVGPLTNLFMWYMLYIFNPNASWLIHFKNINLALFVFNFIPIFPLDGARVLMYLLENNCGTIWAINITMAISRFFAVVFIILGLLQMVLFPYNITMYIFGVYFLKVNRQSKILLVSNFYKFLENKYKMNNMYEMKYIWLNANCFIKKIFYKLNYDKCHNFYFENDGIRQLIEEQELISYIFKNGISGIVKEISETD